MPDASRRRGQRSHRVVASGAVTLLLLAGFVVFFDGRAMVGVLRETRFGLFALGPLAILVTLACWSEAVGTLCAASSGPVDRSKVFVGFCTGTFGRQVLPMGNAVGPVLTAYAVARSTGRRYDESFAVATVDAFLGILANVTLATVGTCVLLFSRPALGVARVLVAGLLAVVLALSVLTGLVLVRRTLVDRVVRGAARLAEDVVGSRVPRYRGRVTPERVGGALQRYYATIDAVGTDRPALVRAFLLVVVGRVCFSLPLYTAALAVGVEISPWLAVFVAVVSGVVAVVPLPGGLGGVEFAAVGFLVLLTDVALPAAAAVVVLYRLCSYGFLVVVTGVVSAFGTVGLRDLPTDVERPRH